MTEQDKLIVEAARHYIHDDLINSLVLLINRLDKQVTEIVEAGKPFVRLDEAVHSDKWGIEQSNVWYGISLVNFQDVNKTISIADPEIHALAQALKGVSDADKD